MAFLSCQFPPRMRRDCAHSWILTTAHSPLEEESRSLWNRSGNNCGTEYGETGWITGKTILDIEVRGKRGVGYCKSMPGAVRPFERLRSRPRPARVYGVNTPPRTSVTSSVL